MGQREPKREDKPPKALRRQNPTQVAFLIKELHKGALWERGGSQNGRKERNEILSSSGHKWAEKHARVGFDPLKD